MGTARRPTGERQPARRAHTAAPARLSLPAKPALAEPLAVIPSVPSGRWTCFLSVVFVILLLILGVIASVFVLGSSHLT